MGGKPLLIYGLQSLQDAETVISAAPLIRGARYSEVP